MEFRTKTYAKNAYQMVVDIKADKELQAEYRTQALNLPTMILQSGLAQSIGFLMAKSKNNSSDSNNAKTKAFQALLSHLEQLLKNDIKAGKTLHTTILESSLIEYQLITRNAIEASSWLKRYTQALLEKEKKQEQNNDPVDA